MPLLAPVAAGHSIAEEPANEKGSASSDPVLREQAPCGRGPRRDVKDTPRAPRSEHVSAVRGR
jgi:hypothetical protein